MPFDPVHLSGGRQGDADTKNNYDIIWHKDGENGTGIFNGDIGYLRAINRQGQEVIAEFDGRRATYPFEQLDQLLETQDGMLRTAQVVSAGISKPVFYDYVHSRELERVAHGIYLSKDAWVDAMYLLHLRVEQAVFSHETALFFSTI